METAINNSVGEGQSLPQVICLLGVILGTEKNTAAHTHTHITAQKHPSHHRPRCCLAWNSCSWSHLSGSLRSEHSVQRVSSGARYPGGQQIQKGGIWVSGSNRRRALERLHGTQNCMIWSMLVTSLGLSFSSDKTEAMRLLNLQGYRKDWLGNVL